MGYAPEEELTLIPELKSLGMRNMFISSSEDGGPEIYGFSDPVNTTDRQSFSNEIRNKIISIFKCSGKPRKILISFSEKNENERNKNMSNFLDYHRYEFLEEIYGRRENRTDTNSQ